MRGAGDEEVREVPRRPPRHVRQAHADGAGTRGVRDDLGRRPCPVELDKARDRPDVLEVRATELERGHGNGELRPHGDPARDEAPREGRPRADGVRGNDDDVAHAVPGKGGHLSRDELRLCRGAGGKEHAKGARG